MFGKLKYMLYFCIRKTTAKGLYISAIRANAFCSYCTTLTIIGYRLPRHSLNALVVNPWREGNTITFLFLYAYGRAKE